MSEPTNTSPSTTPTSAAPSEPPQSSTQPSNTSQAAAQVADLKEQAADPSISKEEKKEIKRKIKELTLKVDGKQYKESLPFEVEEGSDAEKYLRQQLQMAKMAHARDRHSKSLEADIRDFFDSLRKDPKGTLSDPNLSLDLKQLASQILEEEIANSKKSPEQIEKEKLEAELKKIRAEREEEKKQIQQQAFEMQTQQAYQEYQADIINTIEASKDLPKSAYVIKKFADLLLTGIEAGIPLKPADVVDVVREELRSDMKSMFETSPDDMVEAMLGKERLSKIRRRQAAATPPTAPLAQVKDVGKVTKPAEPAKKTNYKDFFKKL